MGSYASATVINAHYHHQQLVCWKQIQITQISDFFLGLQLCVYFYYEAASVLFQPWT